MSWPIVVVTGANGGVGFSICQRFLFQLSDVDQPLPSSSREGDLFPYPCEGLTLIMACRSFHRADMARRELYASLDSHMSKTNTGYGGHAKRFRENLKIEIHTVDLADISSVFAFADEVSETYPYISHFIFNAGVASYDHIDWCKVVQQFLVDPMGMMTTPQYNVHLVGESTKDGLGLVWQSNLFGHYVLFRSLRHLLSAPTYKWDTRVIWMSSIEASPDLYASDDWQLIKHTISYNAVKYQIDVLGTYLDRIALETPDSEKRIRHIVVHPGIASTPFSNKLVNFWTNVLKVVLMYIARWCGSRNHVIDPFNAAVSTIYVCLVPLSILASSQVYKDGVYCPVRFASETNRLGRPEVGVHKVRWWPEHQREAELLVDRCSNLYEEFKSR
ncbi:3-keto sterol reductase [Guyanagaster necrorhizus]|uniref:3-keto sterol reductase n=1 Tax=Guyanagaster necrorhizus TaxID=856835 RepID=A0A9P7VZQ8_9AGAR|nr:3-keto sterol reductase [Guyanagaster necrorhizus MCA 3950]KAG7448766.1 3-keto sterol reductase [Guyanagaster necrorhizus MCA 3950]